MEKYTNLTEECATHLKQTNQMKNVMKFMVTNIKTTHWGGIDNSLNIIYTNYQQVSMNMELMKKQLNFKKDLINVHKNNKSIGKFYYYDYGYSETYLENGKKHRICAPALIWYYHNGSVFSKEYLENGQLHRVDGPAYISYYENGSIKKEEYWKNGERHRIGAPAVIEYKVVSQQYWENGVEIR